MDAHEIGFGDDFDVDGFASMGIEKKRFGRELVADLGGDEFCSVVSNGSETELEEEEIVVGCYIENIYKLDIYESGCLDEAVIGRRNLGMPQTKEASLSASELMMLREAKLVGVGLITLLHFSFLSFCAASENQPCRPSSCGDIQNISYPFRLKGDPLGCGHPDPAYELACENSRTILYGKYHVAEINYDNYTIRVVVVGLEKSNCFSLPLYSLTIDDLYVYEYKYLHEPDTVLLMNCARPIFDQYYIPIVPCNRTDATFSSSQPYAYALAGGYKQVKDLPYSCTIGSTVVTRSFMAVSEPCNLSSSDLQEKLLMGLQLSFLTSRCLECTANHSWCKPNFSNNTIRCLDDDRRNWLQKLKDVLVSVGLFFLIAIIGGRFLLGISCLLGYLIYKFRQRHLSLDDDIEEFLQNHKNLQPIRYSYSHLKKITNNFKNKLGQGGFGSVYKGILQSGRIVAVKVLVMSKANGQDFINEIATIGRIYHVNIVQLVGFCVEGSKWALIYDFMPNGSLDKFIFLKGEKHIPLSWDRLYKIALGVGRGIDYLHQGCDMQILHFDIKPHNILLDEDFTPKVSDFGLAKLYSTNESVVSLTAARGTLGYIAPELFYKNIGHVSYKADVYSFGMLLMEMVGKQRHFSRHQEQDLSELFFPSWIYDQIEQGEDMEMGDVTEDEKKYIWKMVIVALWCVQMKPMDRPSMSKALDMLDGDVELLQLPPKPTLYSHEISALDRENKPMGVQISSHNASITISLDGR
ncbi:LEAF RUST 10 DISEASE-RESISTANCE LOCUS RECEPTOR-LIKE PROTEIN KINASE-like 2.1 [Vitis riparia]|uniref:LEAF RUST 10 DISEASE-RESISTANCE LOCUS RECEPTOR-LIKE PROTEIN KINASE-like 2.1 n=1 Tax=Vitis riparia TaxID=96939 RepID=UPI00155A8385|nr:LEAF RUST 10 DISEASE-RESISTANCE LOCUS RECEPTOR-LIKE PROTEIN KINASE-like 2.1 [Vitis riparia]